MQGSAAVPSYLMRGRSRGLLDTYVLDSRDKGIIFRPGLSKGLECFVDADFAGGWKDGDHDSPELVFIV